MLHSAIQTAESLVDQPVDIAVADSALSLPEKTICFQAFGVRIGIRVSDGELLDPIRNRLPPGWSPCPSETVQNWFLLSCRSSLGSERELRSYQLFSSTEPLLEAASADSVLDQLDWQLRLNVALNVSGLLFVHAGVVGWRGRAIVIPGRSFTGKTTLVAALLEAGATYYSDEYAVFDRLGRVRPYPRPLSIRGLDAGRPRFRDPAAFGALAGTAPLPVGLIAITPYETDAVWEPVELSPAEALMALLDNTVAARSKPSLALSILGTVVKTSKAVKSERGDTHQIVGEFLV